MDFDDIPDAPPAVPEAAVVVDAFGDDDAFAVAEQQQYAPIPEPEPEPTGMDALPAPDYQEDALT